jgi:gas vesicle protein
MLWPGRNSLKPGNGEISKEKKVTDLILQKKNAMINPDKNEISENNLVLKEQFKKELLEDIKESDSDSESETNSDNEEELESEPETKTETTTKLKLN